MYFTHDFSLFIPSLRAEGWGHDRRTFFCIIRKGTIFIHAANGNGINAVNITVVCTTISYEATITGWKCVDSAQFTATLEQSRNHKIDD